MAAAGELRERRASVSRVGRLAVDAAVEHDDRVDAQDRLTGSGRGRRERDRLAAGVLDGDRGGIAVGQLVDVGWARLERHAQLRQDRPPLGRAGCEQERQALRLC
jgi:hypothetical protein